MARYQVMYWKEFPAHVKASDEHGVAKVNLPERFTVAIDAAAMADGSTESEVYLEGWQWGATEEREGSAVEVAEAVAAELERAYTQQRLAEMIRGRRPAV